MAEVMPSQCSRPVLAQAQRNLGCFERLMAPWVKNGAAGTGGFAPSGSVGVGVL